MTLSDENVRDRLQRLDKLLEQLCEPWRADVQWSIELAVASLEETQHAELKAASPPDDRAYALRRGRSSQRLSVMSQSMRRFYPDDSFEEAPSPQLLDSTDTTGKLALDETV